MSLCFLFVFYLTVGLLFLGVSQKISALSTGINLYITDLIFNSSNIGRDNNYMRYLPLRGSNLPIFPPMPMGSKLGKCAGVYIMNYS